MFQRRGGKCKEEEILVHIINNLNFNLVMDKKVLKMYESPAVEIVELNVEGQLMAGSNPDNPLDDSTADTEEME